MSETRGAQVHIGGIVQGVGFRPFVYSLAKRYGLTGWVKNTSAGVELQVDGEHGAIEAFLQALRSETPPLAQIDTLRVEECPPNGFSNFEIIHSQAIAAAFQPIPADIALCSDCQRELFDPADRRYHYPFINCTNCGPRFTIIRDLPYDRPLTSMSGFPLCPACAAEYADPLDRRFHAQPVACPECGPQVWLEVRGPEGEFHTLERDQPALEATQKFLREGKILAIKGLGGFHLACDAANPQAVAELRRRKLRVDKPFAVMLADLEMVERHCKLDKAGRKLLSSPSHPVVILARRPGSSLAEAVSPAQHTLGVMLPYTPLHLLLFTRLGEVEPLAALVMTSGNLSEEPIVTDNEQARQGLAGLADAWLMHDRPIHIRCDDSVLRLNPDTDQPYPLRRARGYAPAPLRLPWESTPLLATGGELKNTFCLTNQEYAFLSHHIGDLENYETLSAFERGIEHYQRLFRVQPVALAYDLHPNYLATRYALERAERENLPSLGIQHHHAHIASLMAEHALPIDAQVIGVAFDGTGYGTDGAIWGGEFLVAGYTGFQRWVHLEYMPLPGGDMATRNPARIALAYLYQAGLDWDPLLPCNDALCSSDRHALRRILDLKINTPLTSSMGRLFDAVAALAGVRQQVNYEAQAAIELEALVDPDETGAYPFEIQLDPHGQRTIALSGLLSAVIADAYAQISAPVIAARFHNSIASLTRQACLAIHQTTGLRQVALSGGVWQNSTLLVKTCTLLRQAGLEPLTHRLVPTNDGGIALGQAAIAAAYYRS